MLQQMDFKSGINATFFIIMVAIIFLDAMVISKYETDIRDPFQEKDRMINRDEIKQMFKTHVGNKTNPTDPKDKLTADDLIEWTEKSGWDNATMNYLKTRNSCICMSLKLGVCYTLFLIHLGIMGLGIIVYVVVCGLNFHKSMYIINIVSFLCLTVGVSVETHFILERNGPNLGKDIWGDDWDNLLKYIIFKWSLFVLNLITICIQSLQCICGYSVDEDNYSEL